MPQASELLTSSSRDLPPDLAQPDRTTSAHHLISSRVTWTQGTLGGLGGLAAGAVGVALASRSSHAFRQLSLPFRAFLVTGTTSFAAVVSADRASRNFEKSRHADADYRNKSEQEQFALDSQKDAATRAKEWVSEQRYPIVFSSWAASMVGSFWLVSRNRFLTGQQKLVQARVYAQGLTLAVLIASFALESNDLRQGKGRWETVRVLDKESGQVVDKRIHHEAYQGEDQWMDMIEAQERKMKARGHKVSDQEAIKKSEGVKKVEEQQKAASGEKAGTKAGEATAE